MYDVLWTPPSNDGSAYIKEIPHFCKCFYLSESTILTFLLKVVIFNLFSNRNEIEIACLVSLSGMINGIENWKKAFTSRNERI